MARSLRYRALGHACYRGRVHCLLTGHHEDDDHELVILRLIQDSRARGLGGMRPSGTFPDCDNVRGIASATRSFDGPHNETVPDRPLAAHDPMLGLNPGGIPLVRPLLRFSKAQLAATCEAAGVTWSEDPTNTDVTLTPRNAVRRLIADGTLPTALQKLAALRTVRVCQAQLDDEFALSEELYRACVFDLYDLHVGSLVVQIPSLHLVFGNGVLAEWSARLKNAVVAGFLRILAEMISGKPDLKLSGFRKAAAGLLMTGDRTPPHGHSAEGAILQPSSSQAGVYAGFIRYVMHADRPSDRSASRWTIQPARYTGFKLWDGRYWVSVENKTAHELVLKASTRLELVHFFDNLPAEQQLWKMVLSRIAPGTAKDTIMSLRLGGDVPEAHRGRIVSLPTLGLTLPEVQGQLYVTTEFKNVGLLQGFESIVLDCTPPASVNDRSLLTPHVLYSYRRHSSLHATGGPLESHRRHYKNSSGKLGKWRRVIFNSSQVWKERNLNIGGGAITASNAEARPSDDTGGQGVE